LPDGLGSWLRTEIVRDRAKVVSFAVAAPVVDTVILLSNLTAFRGAGNLGQQEARAGRAVAEDPSSVAVLEAILRVLDGALAVAKVVKGFCNISENSRILGARARAALAWATAFSRSLSSA